MIAAERWRGLVQLSAARWGATYGVTVPVDVLVAMVQTESSGNTNAKRTEPDGRISRGLLQVLEGTARGMGLANPTRLHEPAVGIDYGVRYFASQLKRYGGVVSHAVAAYNAGSVRFTTGEKYRNQGYVDKVNGWLRRLGGAVEPAGRAVPWVLAVLAGVAVWAVSQRARRRGAAHAA